MKTSFFTLIFFILAFSEIFSQQVISTKRYCSGYSMTNCISPTSDKGFILAGHCSGQIIILKTDSIGNEEWRKNNANFHEGVGVIQTTDGGYMVGASPSANVPQIVMIKTNSQGDGLWSKVLDSAFVIHAERWFHQTQDNGYIIAYNIYGSSLLRLIKLDQNGNEQWKKTFAGKGRAGMHCIRITSDNGYIIMGYTYPPGVGNGSQDYYVLKTDATGNEQWHYYYTASGFQDGMSICQTSGGDFVFVGSNNNGTCDYAVDLIKINSTGSTIWQKTNLGVPGNGAFFMESMSMTNDGGFIIGGNSSSTNWNFTVVRTNSAGNQIWAYNLSLPNSGSGTCRSIVPDGVSHRLVLAGSLPTLGSSAGEEMGLLIMSDSTSYTDIGNLEQNNSIKCVPNPFSSQLTFSLADNEQSTISLYNFLGQQVLQQTFTNSATINTEQMQNGIYFYELRNDKGTLKTGKLVKQ